MGGSVTEESLGADVLTGIENSFVDSANASADDSVFLDPRNDVSTQTGKYPNLFWLFCHPMRHECPNYNLDFVCTCSSTLSAINGLFLAQQSPEGERTSRTSERQSRGRVS